MKERYWFWIFHVNMQQIITSVWVQNQKGERGKRKSESMI